MNLIKIILLKHFLYFFNLCNSDAVLNFVKLQANVQIFRKGVNVNIILSEKLNVCLKI